MEFTGFGSVNPTTPFTFGDGDYDEGSNDKENANSGENSLPNKEEEVE